ncbi:MAG: DUF3108 domain-containing protein, partial [Rikenellaceae bacterium]|nr:DUF3108 domain-containing protein [Rikenellaceae bacterium]
MNIRILALFALLIGALPAAAQEKEAAFGCGEKLEFVVSYRAKLVPNSDVAAVTINTSCKHMDGHEVYHIVGHGKVMPFFKWFFDLNDTYTSWIDTRTLLPVKFNAELREGSYRFTHTMTYDWASMTADSRYRNLKRSETNQRTMQLSVGSFDAVAAFYNLRSQPAESFVQGASRTLKIVLEDTVRSVRYRFLGREERDIKDFGRFKTLKFSCQLATSSGESFEDGA